MPLYKITATFQYVVVAEDYERAPFVARGVAHRALRAAPDSIISINAEEILGPNDLPQDWNGRDIPWGGDGRTTIEEHIDRRKATDACKEVS